MIRIGGLVAASAAPGGHQRQPRAR